MAIQPVLPTTTPDWRTFLLHSNSRLERKGEKFWSKMNSLEDGEFSHVISYSQVCFWLTCCSGNKSLHTPMKVRKKLELKRRLLRGSERLRNRPNGKVSFYFLWYPMGACSVSLGNLSGGKSYECLRAGCNTITMPHIIFYFLITRIEYVADTCFPFFSSQNDEMTVSKTGETSRRKRRRRERRTICMCWDKKWGARDLWQVSILRRIHSFFSFCFVKSFSIVVLITIVVNIPRQEMMHHTLITVLA